MENPFNKPFYQECEVCGKAFLHPAVKEGEDRFLGYYSDGIVPCCDECMKKLVNIKAQGGNNEKHKA